MLSGVTFYQIDGQLCQDFIGNANTRTIPKSVPFELPMQLGSCDTNVYSKIQNKVTTSDGVYTIYEKPATSNMFGVQTTSNPMNGMTQVE